MPQLFPKRSNAIARAGIAVALTLPLVLVSLAYALNGSAFVTGQEIPRDQPVPFSHQHHVQGVGIDCRYCHTTVETLAHAGMPTTHTCMSCHSQIWTNAAELEPVRRSYRDDVPLRWTRVYDLPDFAYFDHSIHVHRGVGCSTCHGRVDRMPLTWLQQPLHMEWCLGCHSDPAPHLRPRTAVFDMEWEPSPDQRQRGETKMREEHVARATHCNTCHR